MNTTSRCSNALSVVACGLYLAVGAGACSDTVFVPFSVDAEAVDGDSGNRDPVGDATDTVIVDDADATVADGGDATDTVIVDDADATVADGGDCPPTPSGTYFCALSFNLIRDAPVYLAMDFQLLPSGDLEVAAQQLVRDFEPDGSPMPRARTPVDTPIATQEVPYGDDGSFELVFAGQTIVGEANPVTFRDIAGTFELSGVFASDQAAFGTMGGDIMQPTPVPLGGSTFACVRSDDFAAIDPVYYDDLVPYEDAGCG